MRFGLRELVFLIVLLSVPIASFVFVFKPRNDEIQKARTEIEQKEYKLAQVDEVSTRIADIGEAIEEWRLAVEKIEAKLPSEQGIDEILEQVWNITAENHLTIISTRTDSPVPASTYMELPLNIKMQGDFDAFYEFLLDLEQLDRITRIHQLHITRAGSKKKSSRGPGSSRTEDEEEPNGLMEAEFTLSIFYEPSSGSAVALAD